MRICLAYGAALILACDGNLDSKDLTAVTAIPQAGPNCAGCHPYPDIDYQHYSHLLQIGRNHADNSPVTCLDCHATAIAFTESPIIDSIFLDSFGDTLSLLNNPYDPSIHGYPMLRADTLRRQLPILMPARSGAMPGIREYVTALAHLNMVVDVAFDWRSSDTARFSGTFAGYDREEQTCSAVACHGGRRIYRWRDL
ncbi:MAG: hypothetical protein JWO30_4309 [Fibrobacteres bacterium]|nr:hypothetical protein [Fibrobacterota bacterium]